MSTGITYRLHKQPVTLYYTGKTVNATAGSRTAVAVDLKPGMVVCRDPHQHAGDYFSTDGAARADGASVTRPATGWLHMPAYVVTEVKRDSQRGGWITAVPLTQDFYGQIICNANITSGDVVCLVADSFFLGVPTVFAATNQATFKTLGAKRMIACETLDTSSTAALTWVSGSGV